MPSLLLLDHVRPFQSRLLCDEQQLTSGFQWSVALWQIRLLGDGGKLYLFTCPYLVLTFHGFYINLPCGAIAAASFIFFYKVPKGVKPAEATLREKVLQMDVHGFLVIVCAVVCYLLAMQWGGVMKSWDSADVVGTLVGSILLLLLFLTVEWYQGEKVLLLSGILRRRTIALGGAFGFLCVLFFATAITVFAIDY